MAEGVDFLAHNQGDHVAVAVRDVPVGTASVAWLDGEERSRVEVREPVPYGHKVALADLGEGAEVIEYGVRVALARKPISRGDLVHVHNVRSAQWQHSA